MEETYDHRPKTAAVHTCRCGETANTKDLVAAVGDAIDRGVVYRCPKCGDASAWIAARITMALGYRTACTAATRWDDDPISSSTDAALRAARSIAASAAGDGAPPVGVDDGGECRIPYCGEEGPLVGCCSVGKHALHAACLASCLASPPGDTCPLCRDGFVDVLMQRCTLPRLCLPVLCGKETDPYSAAASATSIRWLRLSEEIKCFKATRE